MTCHWKPYCGISGKCDGKKPGRSRVHKECDMKTLVCVKERTKRRWKSISKVGVRARRKGEFGDSGEKGKKTHGEHEKFPFPEIGG